MPRAPKTEFLQIRLSQEDRDRIAHVASNEYLEPSTWARQVLLKSVEDWEKLNLPKQDAQGGAI